MFRRHLPNRRSSVTMKFRDGHVTVSFFEDGTPGEVFVNAGKVNSDAAIAISDAAVAVSLALQYGCPLSVLRSAVKREESGTPQGAVGAALDAVARLDDA